MRAFAGASSISDLGLPSMSKKYFLKAYSPDMLAFSLRGF